MTTQDTPTTEIEERPPVPTEPSPSTPAPPKRRRPWSYYLEAYTLPALLVLAAGFFSVWGPTRKTFLSPANLEVLVSSNAVVALVAVAALIPLVCFEFDLSVGAISGLSAVYVASLLADGHSLLSAFLVAVLIGLALGLTNALLVTRLGVNAVITTLGMATIIAGLISLKTGGVPVTGHMPPGFIDFGTKTTLGIPRIAYALALAALVVYYVLEYTPYGRQLYALGSSRRLV
jgi:ribose transport system permease protein